MGGVGGFHYVNHQLSGVEATATLLERSVKCAVDFQYVGDSQRTNKDMECRAATALQQREGSDKIKLRREELVKLRVVGPDGYSHEVKVSTKSAPRSAKLGEPFPVIFDPAHPEEIAAPYGAQSLMLDAGVTVLGLTLLVMGLGVNPLRLLGALSLGVARRRNDEAPPSATALDEALERMRTISQPAPPPLYAPASGFAQPQPVTFGRRRSA